MTEYGTDYPPGYSSEKMTGWRGVVMANCPSKGWDRYYDGQVEACDVCLRHCDDCDCEECPVCHSCGDPKCHDDHGLKHAPDSIHAFCDSIGIEPVSSALRAIDKHNVEHVWLVLHTGERVYYHNSCRLAELDKTSWLRLKAVGVGGIAWDGSDWEWSGEVQCDGDWSKLDRLREEFHEALDEHSALMEVDEND